MLQVATRLGLTSFGGPIAHLGYFREEYVARRKWLDEATYAELVALCQFLPGPASSQVGIAIGITRAGLLGGVAAWLGFTLPSAVAMVAFAYGLRALDVADTGWLHGLKVAAVAVVAQAVWGMARALAPDRERATVAILSAVAALLWPTAHRAGHHHHRRRPGGLAAPARDSRRAGDPERPVPVGRRLGHRMLALFFGLLVALPVARRLVGSHALAVFDSFFRAGSLVFGGRPRRAAAAPGGGRAARLGDHRAVRRRLRRRAGRAGSALHLRRVPRRGDGSAAQRPGRAPPCALVAIFLPSFLLIVGALPFWDALRARAGFQAALRGINAAVVGLLLAALYQPVWTSAIRAPADVGLALAMFGLLAFWKVPAWLVVILAAAGGAVVLR